MKALCTPEISEPFLQKLSALQGDELEDWEDLLREVCNASEMQRVSEWQLRFSIRLGKTKRVGTKQRHPYAFDVPLYAFGFKYTCFTLGRSESIILMAPDS